MFNTNYIYELTSGQLSNEGYKHFINVVSCFVKKNNWPKSSIVNSENNATIFWTQDEIKEVTHQFFEWALSKGKFDNLNKIPENYLSYYFTQILISFIANRIKEEQQKEGLSYEKCRELVISICKEDFINKIIEGNEYVFNSSFSKEDIKHFGDITDILFHLSKTAIFESTKHYRPLVKLAINDVFSAIETPILLSKLTEVIFNLFNQKSFISLESKEEQSNEFDLEPSNKIFDEIIQNIVSGLTNVEARMISQYLFNNEDEKSLSELADIYGIPKSTFHHKMDSFKKKISKNYTPDNEQDGIVFLQSISKALDKLSN